ncbi:hypothetical protein D3C83_155510 [compost metagenome]
MAKVNLIADGYIDIDHPFRIAFCDLAFFPDKTEATDISDQILVWCHGHNAVSLSLFTFMCNGKILTGFFITL